MSLIRINSRPNRKKLRSFGKIALAASVVISLLLYFLKGVGIQWAFVTFGAGLLVFLSSIVSLKLTRAIYLFLTLVTFPIGWVISHLLLAAFYFLIITPFGLVFRLIGRDLLHCKFDSSMKSYWLRRHPPDSLEQYFRQF